MAQPPTGAQGGAASTARLAGVGIGVVVAAVLPPFLTASLVVRIREDFALSESQLGLAMAVTFAAATLSSPPAGRVVDRVGPLRGIQASLALSVACALGIGLVVRSPGALIGVLALAGPANALSAPGASALISGRMTRRREGLGLGIQQAGAPAGALLAGLALPAIAVPLDWRWAFGAAALVAAGVALAARPLQPGARSQPAAGVEPAAARPAPRARRRLPTVHLLALAAALSNVAVNGMVAFLVLFAVEEGLSEASAGLVLAAGSLAAGASRVAFGAIADARGGRVLTGVVWLLAGSAVGFVLLATGAPAAIVAGALVAGGIGWGWSGLMTLSIVQQNRDAPGAAVGVGMTGIYVGAGAGPLLVGVIAESASFTVAWLVGAALVLMAAAVALAARRASAPPPAPPSR